MVLGGFKMKIKKFTLILIAFVTLILSMGIICASENISDLETQDNNIDVEASADTSDAEILKENSTQTQQNTPSTTTTSPSKQKIKTKVEADQKAVKYKKSTYFKVKVEDRYDDDIPIKNVKLKIKVGNKEFKVKTNSYGVAKINTKTLKKGTHKVVITSLDERYSISKTSKIFVGKQYTATLKSKSTKTLKNKDVIRLKFRNDFDEKEVKVVFKKKAKFTKILKAKFVFKDKKTGRTVVKTDNCDWDDGKWEMPDADYPNRYTLVNVKVYYISTK